MKPNALLDGIFENAPYPMWISDKKGTLIRISRACRDLLHLEDAEIVGKYNVFEDEIVIAEGLAPLIRQVYEEGKRVNFILKYDSSKVKSLDAKEGAAVVLDITVSPVLDARGKVAHAIFQHIDITRRQQAEELLRESEDKYRSIFENTGTGTIIVEEDMTIVLANAQLEKLTGYSKAEVEGKKKWTDFVAKEDLEKMKGYHAARRNDPDSAPRSYEFRLLDRRGNIKNVLLTVALVAGTRKSIASIWDLTERKRAEEALRESEERWQFALEGSGDGVWDWNPQTNKVHFSRQWKAMLGYGEAEIGDTFEDWARIVHPDDYPRAIAEVDKHLRGESPVYRSEHRLLCKDGGYKWILARGKVIRQTEDGKPLRMIGTHTDITARKSVEEALRESEAKYRLLHESMTEAYGRADLAGRIQETNRAYQAMTGYSEEELRQLSYRDLTPEKWHALETRIIEEQVLKQGHSQVYEKEYRKKDGTVFPVELRVFLLRDDAGESVGMWAVVRDITGRKRAEEELRQSEEKARRLAAENEAIAEIGRIISSTVNIEEVYEHFAREAKKIIPFDRIAVGVFNPGKKTFSIPYASGVEVPAYPKGAGSFSIGNKLLERAGWVRPGILFQIGAEKDARGEEAVKRQIPSFLPFYRAGLRSLMRTPLISEDQTIGVLSLLSLKSEAYAEDDLRVAGRIADQIAGAVANAQLFQQRKQAEEAARESEEKARRLAAENEAMAEIGRIVSSTLDIGEVYERFAAEAKKLVPFDRITIIEAGPAGEGGTLVYDAGMRVPTRISGNRVPAGSVTDLLMKTHKGLIVQGKALKEFAQKTPGYLPVYQAGLRSLMAAPLILRDQFVGTLAMDSLHPEFYADSHLEIAERIANQIAGAVASARLYRERKRAEEAARESEETARRLAAENEVVAGIGRIISSTLDIGEVYERFAAEVKKLLPFDRITIVEANPADGWATLVYEAGLKVPTRRSGDRFQLAGSVTSTLLETQAGLILQAKDREEFVKRFPGYLPAYQAGFRSFLAVPLILRDQFAGAFSLNSLQPDSYSDRDLRIAARIANQIAGAVASARLYSERKRAEEAARESEEKARRLAAENEAVAGIGRIISSTLDIGEVYERFAAEVKKLLPFDRIALVEANPAEGWGSMVYDAGLKVAARRSGDRFQLAGSVTGLLLQTREGLIIRERDMAEFMKRVPGYLSLYQTGFRSFLAVPLILRDQFVGAFAVNSLQPAPYSEPHLRIAARIANQIAGAVASARLYAERKRAEEAARESEEKARQLAAEKEVVAEIGRIISSSLDIDEVYEHFAQEAKKIIRFDRITVSIFDAEVKRYSILYTAGVEIPGYRKGDWQAIRSEALERAGRVRPGIIFHASAEGGARAEEEIERQYPSFLAFYRAGLRSAMRTPLISKDQTIGSLNFLSREGGAYAASDLKVAARIANQIAGAVANAQLFQKQKQAEEAARESEEKARRLAAENEVVAEIGRIISSTLDIGEVYERFAAEVKRLVPFDRISINEVNVSEGTGVMIYTTGLVIPGRKMGDFYPLAGSATEELLRSRSGLLVQGEGMEEFTTLHPPYLPCYQAGVRSMLSAPLFLQDRIVGGLILDSLRPDAYSEQDLKLIEKIANQIAGAVANAQLFQKEKQAEEELRQSEERARRLAAENEVVAEIGRIISSSVNIEDVYERFAQEAKRVIRFDRITISIPDEEEKTFSIPYASGIDVPAFRKGDRHPIPLEPLERGGRVWPGIIFHAGAEGDPRSEEEIKRLIPSFLPSYRAGLRSAMRTPLLFNDRPIGVLTFFSRESGAYAESDLKVAARIANQIAGAVANAQLFQKQKRTEKELFNSSEQYRRLVDLSPLVITLVDKEGKYVYMNPAGLKTIGALRLEEMVGKSVLDITHPDSREDALNVLRLMEEGKTVPVFHQKCIRLDGRVIDVELNQIQPLGQDDDTVLVVGRDITEQVRAERERAILQEQLQQSQKMEAIGTLAGGIAHDFNNILAAILGYAELAGLDIPEDSKARYNLQQSIKSAHRAKELVQQILAFSRQGKQERKPVDIRPVVKEALKFLRASLPTTIEIRQEIEEDPGAIEANPTQIHQVLMNLCANAAHAMADRGGVLEVSLIKVDPDEGIFTPSTSVEPGSYLRLRVRDTGHGMSPDILKKIFDPYFTTKEVGKGTGLGLSVVHGIVKSYGGEISVASEVGKGSTFDIYFPRIEAPLSVPEPGQAEPLPRGNGERVLFVDDEQMIAEVGQNILEHLGYGVEARTSSVEALELFRAAPERFDLVMTDLTMPNLTGDRLAQEILEIRPEIPVVLCTGFSESISDERVKALGVRDFVMKPMVIKDLAKTIRKALGARKQEKG